MIQEGHDSCLNLRHHSAPKVQAFVYTLECSQLLLDLDNHGLAYRSVQDHGRTDRSRQWTGNYGSHHSQLASWCGTRHLACGHDLISLPSNVVKLGAWLEAEDAVVISLDISSNRLCLVAGFQREGWHLRFHPAVPFASWTEEKLEGDQVRYLLLTPWSFHHQFIG